MPYLAYTDSAKLPTLAYFRFLLILHVQLVWLMFCISHLYITLWCFVCCHHVSADDETRDFWSFAWFHHYGGREMCRPMLLVQLLLLNVERDD